jgi:hypothetical protein
MAWVTRVLTFVLGLAILVDTLLDNPSNAFSILLALCLMGVITIDQIAALVRRNGRNGPK